MKNDSARPAVVIETSKGDIRAELWADLAPATVENFLQYVDAGHYDDVPAEAVEIRAVRRV